jgi:lipopolysaccharide assembly outer membrane protein LptD (OstA)
MKTRIAVALAASLLAGVGIYIVPGLRAQSVKPKLQLTNVFTSRGKAVILAADEIERGSAEIRLRGNVEIELRPQQGQDVMILHADEADYKRQNDEIIPRGNIRVTLERPR